ncbi:transcriptional regulator with XRE-family HTH domain [Rhodopseudomonas julia]|uniref:Transcriptional regulator with XRE-family HTH domain n=1 Tax=Rhodopseudomonas julia TaxID=200617 RepID=A0ABU0C2K6_9BRAD|nr:helix-turn-helix transcriptional regulator [Rhodopseudomonas julia]MDQ0324452.1 transcriptional regulator with XRE-family HTH domain [Rhodopseudomonas julia]
MTDLDPTRLKNLRKELGLTQAQLAERLSTTQQTIARWEGGRAHPSIAALRDLAVIFGVSVDDILGTNPLGTKPASSHYHLLQNDSDGYWGNLGIRLLGSDTSRWYPLSAANTERVYEGIGERRWLSLATLNNRVLLINQPNIKALSLLPEEADAPEGDWDVAYPEVEGVPLEIYRALADVAELPDADLQENYSPALIETCRDFLTNMNIDEENAYGFVFFTHVHFTDGTSQSGHIEAKDAVQLFLEAEEDMPATPILLRFAEKGIDMLVPEEAVAFIDMPLIDVIDAMKKLDAAKAAQTGASKG